MENKQLQIHIEKIKLFYQNSFIPIVLSDVAGLCLVAALWTGTNHLHLLIWLVVTILFACISVMLITMFYREKPVSQAVLKWEAPYSISLLVVFLCWSVGLIWIMPRDNLSAFFILNTFSIGLAGAAISWYSSLRYLQMATISLALIPIIIVLPTLGSLGNVWDRHCSLLHVCILHDYQSAGATHI